MNKKRAMKCRERFHKGQKERLNHPLPYGVYKMKEAGGKLERCLECLRKIIKHRRSRLPMPRIIGHCAKNGARSWVKEQPLHIAEDMGHDILPGIEALIGDGVSKGGVQSIRAHYKPVICAIVVQCDAVHRGRSNYDRTLALLCLAVETIDEILCDAGHPRKKT